MAEFVTPEFLQNSTTDDIHKVILAVLPADIDVSEGSHAWNLTRSTALAVAEMREFHLPEAIKLIFPEWSYGEFVDSHAKSRGMTRRAAVAATGELTITGNAGTSIPAGSLFSTASVNGEPSVDYMVLESAVIPEEGSVTVDIQCTQTGIIGNTQADTIVLVSGNIKGIKAVTNAKAITGGTAEESDESLIQRIVDKDQSQGDSFTGCVSDYKRWAMEVPGVGSATVISAQDDTGLVTIILTDANGDPATEKLCAEVYEHIMQPDNPDERLAPINAYLSVVPPATMEIGIKVTVELVDNGTLEGVRTAYMTNLTSYLMEALDEGEIKYTRLWAALSATAGVNDFTDLQFGAKGEDGTITYGTSNIRITSSQLPTITSDDLILTAGTV